MHTNWLEITQEELNHLYFVDNYSDRHIAQMFNVSPSKVAYKRKKFGLTYIKRFNQDFISENSDLFATLNEQAKDRLNKQENINWICKAIVYRIFRNGPVEDMHANGSLSQEDMKTLNKYMVDHVGMLLSAAFSGDWLVLELWLSHYKKYGSDWDNPDLDTAEMKRFMMQNYQRQANSDLPQHP